ncbi:hypothetical protein QBE54_03765 [Thermatribacter velox]|jgi:hypothetical protein|uniref:DUF4013 domain-containing protein n=1 Tax=Thermatribacter velox TaxID=3039681 RepID=A0ABZ2YGH6_9BACT|nr:hypothetical protein [Candidatus Atribacteria bacterium]
MLNFDFWTETKRSARFVAKNPTLWIVSLLPALPFVAASLVAARGSVGWWFFGLYRLGLGFGLFLLGSVLSILVAALIMIAAWDYSYRSIVDLWRAFRMIGDRFLEILITALIISFVVGFFSVFFIFPGLFFAFLLLFVLPEVIIDGRDPFSALQASFHLVLEHLGECFAFFVGLLFFALVGLLLGWVFSFVPIAGVILGVLIIAALLPFLTTLLTRFYLSLTRY